MKKAITVFMTVVMMTASLVCGCSNEPEYDPTLFNKAYFSHFMWFHTTYDGPGLLSSAYLKGDVSDIEFVYSEDENVGFEEGVVVAWPSDETVLVLGNLNRYTKRHEVDLTEYSLTYPITMEDVVERWELVYDYLSSISVGKERIRLPSPESE
jgi:hypothetical protein